MLAEVGAELVVGGCRADDEVAHVAADADVILNTMYFMDRALIEQLPACRMLLRGGVGVDNVDVEAATNQGILVCNVPDFNTNEVANHTMAMLLALNRKLFTLDGGARTGNPRPPATSLQPRPVVWPARPSGSWPSAASQGRGSPGPGVADLRVLACDPFVPADEAAALGVELVGLDELLGRHPTTSRSMRRCRPPPVTSSGPGTRAGATPRLPRGHLTGWGGRRGGAPCRPGGAAPGGGWHRRVRSAEPVSPDHPLLALETLDRHEPLGLVLGPLRARVALPRARGGGRLPRPAAPLHREPLGAGPRAAGRVRWRPDPASRGPSGHRR